MKMQNYVIFVKNVFLEKLAEDVNHRKVRDHCHYRGKYRGAADIICNLKCSVHNEIPAVFHMGV